MTKKRASGKKIRKVWVIKPVSRVKGSRKQALLDKERAKEAKDYGR